MAKEIVTICDANVVVKIKDCGESHDDTRTFTVRLDGEAWEIDLGGAHAQALIDLARRGRQLDPGLRRPSNNSSLERRIRQFPTAPDEG